MESFLILGGVPVFNRYVSLIKVLEDPFDKRAMLSRSNRADFDKYPKKYADRNCYIGSVMIVGEIVK